ncbi:MAG: T9SS type A sorting domain-containing protein [Bacteroidales bacterium]|nr:T9SS type A sorting domain-containing protein [Bacteroidales bacterium]
MIFKKIQTRLLASLFIVTMIAQLNAQQNNQTLAYNADSYEVTSSPGDYTNYIPSDPVLKAAEYKCNKPKKGWADSYSVNGKCYCATSFDHNIGGIKIKTPAGKKTVKEICNKIGKGPGKGKNPVYNTVQCGHAPYNNAGDEDPGCCPGRVDQGAKGCSKLGPKWDLSVFKKGKSESESGYELQENAKEFDVYPNPASKQVTVRLNGKENVQVQLINLSGQVVFEQHVASNMVNIPLSNYQPGTYVMRFTDNKSSTSRTFIIE